MATVTGCLQSLPARRVIAVLALLWALLTDPPLAVAEWQCRQVADGREIHETPYNHEGWSCVFSVSDETDDCEALGGTPTRQADICLVMLD